MSIQRSLPELFRAHHAFVHAVARGRGLAAADASDVVQRVFVVLVRRLTDIDAGKERAFLRATTVRVASEVRRSAHRRREVVMETLPEQQAGEGPEAALQRAREVALLRRALEQLPTELRQVIVLRELDGYTAPETAARLGIPTGTAASRLRRARESLTQIVTTLATA